MSTNVENLSKNLKNKIESFMNESLGLISSTSSVDFNDIDFLISEGKDGQVSLEYNKRLWQMVAIRESGEEYEEVTVRLIKKFKNKEEFIDFISSDKIIEISSISIDQITK